jgi:hypothetical protein
VSPEYHINEHRLQAAHRSLWRIDDDRRANGTDDQERERAHAAAVGAVHGYQFRDAELFFEEIGISPHEGRR